MCLGAYGTIVELVGESRAVVRFDDGTQREVSLAVLVADGVAVEPGATVAVSIGMALQVVDPDRVFADLADRTRGTGAPGDGEEVV